MFSKSIQAQTALPPEIWEKIIYLSAGPAILSKLKASCKEWQALITLSESVLYRYFTRRDYKTEFDYRNTIPRKDWKSIYISQYFSAFKGKSVTQRCNEIRDHLSVTKGMFTTSLIVSGATFAYFGLGYLGELQRTQFIENYLSKNPGQTIEEAIRAYEAYLRELASQSSGWDGWTP